MRLQVDRMNGDDTVMWFQYESTVSIESYINKEVSAKKFEWTQELLCLCEIK